MRLITVNWFVFFISIVSSLNAVAVSDLWLNRYAYDAI
jgi:soluble lytic murein transglycosylase